MKGIFIHMDHFENDPNEDHFEEPTLEDFLPNEEDEKLKNDRKT
jgi:serine protease Do